MIKIIINKVELFLEGITYFWLYDKDVPIKVFNHGEDRKNLVWNVCLFTNIFMYYL